MKRIAAILTALVLMACMASTVYADSKVSDAYLEGIKGLYETYQKTPEAFGDEAIVIAYCEYQLYENSLLMEMMQTNLQMPVSLFGDDLKPTAAMFTALTDIMSDEFKKWAGGETSSEQFLSYIMSLYKVSIETKQQ